MKKVLDDMIKAIENFEEIDQVSTPLAKIIGKVTHPRLIKNALSGTWLGHQFHPMATDLPIGAWLSAGVIDLLGSQTPNPTTRKLVGIGILAAIPAAASGASDWSDTVGPDQRVGYVHALANSTALSLQILSYLKRRHGKQKSAVVLSTAALAAVGVAGYLGGHLTLRRGMGVDHSVFQNLTEEWTKVATFSELKNDKPLEVNVGETPVVLISHNDLIYALSSTCVHAGGPLAEGEVKGDRIVCPWHGSQFRISNGQVVRGPASVSQPCWEVRVVDKHIEVRAKL